MLIIGDETRHRGLPWVTFSLIGINVLVFVTQVFLGDAFTRGFALVPAEIVQGRDLVEPTEMKVKVAYRDRYPGRDYGKVRHKYVYARIPQAPGPFPIHLTLFTSMFLHGGWLHLLGNMWFLAVFGRNVERAMGGGLFLACYVASGLFAGLADVLVDGGSLIPYLGASGAISGIMGVYFFLFPFNTVKVWLGWYWGTVDLPAVVVVGFWLVMQYLSTVAAITEGTVHGGVAYWAHLAGFAAGILFVLGTLTYLKWSLKREEEAAERGDVPPEREPQREVQEAPDPYANFLPK